ncbi:MAG: hypothetical protein H6Q10_2184 [Acidobacteria bacterium]|nr:hypothetical protein [Acidobacteriota bacterium]
MPSGEKLTLRSCPGVLVTRLVTPPSTLVTNTSPRKTNAISLPVGETASSRAPPVTGSTRRAFARASTARAIATFCGCAPGFIV